MKMLIPILFACGTALCWGLYGPAIQHARSTSGEWSAFKPYVFIGIAYLVWACLGGAAGMMLKGDSFSYTGTQSAAMNWGFIAGSLGAIGAFSLTSAMLSGGKPLFVMPIVFGGAVSVTAIASIIELKALSRTSPMLWVGMLLVVVGVVLVAANTPHGHAPMKAPTASSGEVTPPSTDSGDPTKSS